MTAILHLCFTLSLSLSDRFRNEHFGARQPRYRWNAARNPRKSGCLGAALTAGLLFFPISVWAQNPCDLNSDGTVNTTDVQLAINMTLGLSSCTANIDGPEVCDAVVVQRVINAADGGSCVIGNQHSVSLSWTASVSQGISGYNVYRGTTSGGPYTKINSTLVTVTNYTDTTVLSNQTYYYVATAVNTANSESAYSSPAEAIIPYP